MANNVLELCEKYTEHLNFDLDLAKKIENFKLQWISKDDDHLDFITSNLTGTHVIRFSARDEEMLYTDVFGVDKDNFEYDLWKVPGINKNFRVSSNPTFILLMYLCHMYLKSKLSKQNIEIVVTNLYMLFAFKVLGSIYSNYFKYPCDRATAKMVYERQSDRYLLKKYGSWQAVLEYRARDLYNPANSDINVKRIKTFSTDDVVKLLNDLQGRIRDIIKNVYVIISNVKEDGTTIGDSSLIGIGGEDNEEIIKDTDNKILSYIKYINNIFSTPVDFVQDDLLDLIRDKKLCPGVDKNMLKAVLIHISSNDSMYLVKDKINIPEYLISNAMGYLTNKGLTTNMSNRLYEVFISLKAYWSSSSVKDPILKKIKAFYTDEVIAATGKRTTYIVATYVIAVLLYIFIRAYRMSKK